MSRSLKVRSDCIQQAKLALQRMAFTAKDPLLKIQDSLYPLSAGSSGEKPSIMRLLLKSVGNWHWIGE